MKKVLIIGAGPTGLFVSYLLKKRGIDVRLIDKAAGPSNHSKAIAIHSRTLEIFEMEGLQEHFLAIGMKIKKVCFHNEQKLVSANFAESEATYPFVLGLPQTETERILIEANRQVGVEVEWNCEISDYDETVPIMNGEKLDHDWVIACDGAHSISRKSHSFTFKGAPLHDEVLLADVLADSPYPAEELHVIFKKRLASFIFPMQGGRYRIMFGHKHPHEYEEADLPKVCEQYGFDPKFKINQVLWLNNFKLSERMVNSLREDNLFILGDAAHVHSPLLGQGMNTCFQDAYNLAWKLEMVIKGEAHAELLDSVSAERLPIVRGMLRKTSSLTKLFAKENVPLAFVIRILKMVMHFAGIQKKIVQNFSMISLGYKNSPITLQSKNDASWRGPKLGFRFPNVQVGDGSTLFDHLKGHKHLLIHFDPSAELANNKLYDVLCIKDKESQKRLAAKTESVFLIRPDGHVGYRSKEGDLSLLGDYLDRLHYCVDREGIVLNV